MKQLWDIGLQEYVNDMWNVIDFVTNSLYVATVALRVVSYFQVIYCGMIEMQMPLNANHYVHASFFTQVQKEMLNNSKAADLPREQWNAWDPMLISG